MIVTLVVLIMINIGLGFLVGQVLEDHMYGRNKDKPIYSIDTIKYSTKTLKFGSEREWYVNLLLIIFPTANVTARYSTFSRKTTLRIANELYRCKSCGKYNRGYQTALVGEEGCCVHCDSHNIKLVEVNEDLKVFLDTFPECPRLKYKEVKSHMDLYIAKLNKVDVDISNNEIERIMKSYEQTGNKYMEKLYSTDK